MQDVLNMTPLGNDSLWRTKSLDARQAASLLFPELMGVAPPQLATINMRHNAGTSIRRMASSLSL